MGHSKVCHKQYEEEEESHTNLGLHPPTLPTLGSVLISPMPLLFTALAVFATFYIELYHNKMCM